jgi:hypothetical protein
MSFWLDELTAIRRALVATASRLSAQQWKRRVPFPWGGEGTANWTLEGLCQHALEHVRPFSSGE